MEMQINSNMFGFDFFLSDYVKVDNLETGAKMYGGATRFDSAVYSNIEGNDLIEVKDFENELSIFIPSTTNVDVEVDNKFYVEESLEFLEKYYNIHNLRFYRTEGSWYSEDKKEVIIENITIITVTKDDVSPVDIYIFKLLADWIKKEMRQEGVTITVNSAMAIV